MSLRPDEPFVLNRLVVYVGGPKVAFGREGKDPPDAYLKIGRNTVAKGSRYVTEQ